MKENINVTTKNQVISKPDKINKDNPIEIKKDRSENNGRINLKRTRI